MSFVYATFRKDLSRWRQDVIAIAIWLGIPLMIGGLMTALMDRGDDGGPMGTVLIADQDESLVSGFIVSAFSRGEMSELLAVQTVTVEEGTALIDAGEASGFLVIPDGFQEAFLGNTAATLTLKTNPSQTIIPGIIEDVTEILLDAGFYLRALFDSELRLIDDGDGLEVSDDAQFAAISLGIKHKFEQLEPHLNEPLFDLEVVEPPPSEPRPDYGILFLAGVVLMSLVFAAQGLSSDFWTERDSGALQRLVSAPGVLRRFVSGKVCAAAVLMALIGGVPLLLGFLYHDIAWQKLLPSMLWITVAGVGLFAWFAALQMMLPNSRAANLLTTLIIFPLLMMGGSFFPLDALPDWLAAIGRLSPNGYVVERLSGELTSASAWTFDARAWSTVAAIGVSGMLLCSWRLQSGFARR